MKYLYSLLNDLMVCISFMTTSVVLNNSHVLGVMLGALSFALLDLHSYIDKKLNYPNNLFIKSESL